MKNFRKAILKHLEDIVLKEGYVYDDLETDGIEFICRRAERFYLLLDFQDSNVSPERFTCGVSMGLLPCGGGSDHSFRLYQLLTNDEKKKVFPNEPWKRGYSEIKADAWWNEHVIEAKDSKEAAQLLEKHLPMILEAANRIDTPERRQKLISDIKFTDRVRILKRIYSMVEGGKKFDGELGPKLERWLSAKAELPDIGRAARHLFDVEGVRPLDMSHTEWDKYFYKNIYEGYVFALACDCYNMFYRKYPSASLTGGTGTEGAGLQDK